MPPPTLKLAGVSRVCVFVDELDAIVQLVANGGGVALIPQTGAHRRWPAAVTAIDLGRHTFHRDIGLVHWPESSLGEPARLLLQLICGAYASRRLI